MAGSWVPGRALSPVRSGLLSAPVLQKGSKALGCVAASGMGRALPTPQSEDLRGSQQLQLMPLSPLTTTRTHCGFLQKKRLNEVLNNGKTTFSEIVTCEVGRSEAGGNPDSFMQFLFNGQQYSWLN